MIPPTPTQFPTTTPIFVFPQSYGLWEAADPALQFWYSVKDPAVALQIMMLIGIIILGITVVMAFVHQQTKRDSES